MGNLKFVEITPDPAILESQLLTIADEVAMFLGPLEAARTVVAAGIQRSFSTQSDPSGVSWQPWSESYEPRAWREIASGVHLGQILERSLALREAATSEYAIQVSYDSLFFSWASLPVYGAVQNFGGVVGKGAMIPPREFIGIDALDEARIIAIFDQWAEGITQGIHGGFGRFVSVKGM